MKKISKKIVSLVTMAAFVLTLVPVAAFGANATVAGSSFAVTPGDNALTVTVTLDDSDDNTNVRLKVDFDGIDAAGVDMTPTNATGATIEQLTGTGATPDASQTSISFAFTNVPAGEKDVTVEMSVNAGTDFDPVSSASSTVTVTNPLSQVSNLTSSFYTVDEDVTTDVDTPVSVEFNFRDKSNVPLTNVNLSDGVAVWATQGDNVVTDALVVKNGSTQENDLAGKNVANVYKVTDLADLTVEFTRTGTYTLHAAKNNTNAESVADFADQFQYRENQQVVEVTADAAVIADVTLSGDGVTGADKTWSADLAKANGRATNTHKVTVADKDGVPVEGATFTVSANSTKVNLDGTSFTTDENGEFEFSYSASADDNYKIYIKNAKYGTITLNVTAGDPEATTPDTIAANEKDVVLDDTQAAASLANVVTFTITDTKGNVLNGDNGDMDDMMENEPAVKGGDEDYMELITKPDNFRGKATEFKLIYDKDAKAYTLAYTGSASLVAGDYTLEVGLESGNSCQASFTLGDFDASAIESLQVVPTSDTVEFDKTVAPTVTYDVLAVDANGVSSDITNSLDWTLGLDYVNGIKVTPGAKGSFTVDFSAIDNKEDVLGTEITITAASSEYGIAQGTVTIVDAGVVADIEFDSTEGEVNKDNKVKASAVDADGNVLKGVDGKVFAYVAGQSNKDAVVEVTPGQNAADGVATITIFSDKETTVDIVVGIQKDAADPDSAIYAATLTYTIGAADVTADTLVGMTIGSPDYIVNNDVVAGDAAPYIDEAWRTMVPVRVINELFGATVDYKDNVITIVNGDTTVVMTVGETAYTVNGTEYTMDTAPVIRDNDRAYVPVRFMAEALGYSVTPLKDANGLTAGVVFQK